MAEVRLLAGGHLIRRWLTAGGSYEWEGKLACGAGKVLAGEHRGAESALGRDSSPGGGGRRGAESALGRDSSPGGGVSWGKRSLRLTP